jgi:hypothetical protein
MDELDRAVGSNPTSSVNPLKLLHTLIRRLFADEFDSTHDSRTRKVLCFLSPLAFVETHVEVHLPRARGFSWIHARLLYAIIPFQSGNDLFMRDKMKSFSNSSCSERMGAVLMPAI